MDRPRLRAWLSPNLIFEHHFLSDMKNNRHVILLERKREQEICSITTKYKLVFDASD